LKNNSHLHNENTMAGGVAPINSIQERGLEGSAYNNQRVVCNFDTGGKETTTTNADKCNPLPDRNRLF